MEIKVLDHGFVRLDDYMGSDLDVVNAARVSFGTRSDYELVEVGDQCYCEDSTKSCDCFSYKRKLKPADEGLIRFLIKNRHGTPFEHNAFKFHVKAPLFVLREWHRHRWASYNELSGRYKKFENPDFYVPRPENFRTQVGKPGSYTFEQWKGNTKQATAVLLSHYRDCVDLYDFFIEKGLAKEQARMVLPLAMYSEMYVTVNARALMNFLSLRNAPDALWEIKEYAILLEQEWSEHMPVTAQAFVDNGRIAP